MAEGLYGWRAHLVDDFLRGQKRLVIYRNAGNEVEVNNNDGTWTRHDQYYAGDDSPGFVLPHGAWEAIVALVQPAEAEREIARLTEALEIERRRVDDVLATIRRSDG